MVKSASSAQALAFFGADGIEGVVDLASLDDVLCLLVNLITDGLRIIAGRGDEEIQRLHPGIAGAFGHDIKEFAVRLRVQFIEYHTVSVEAVLIADICGKHLVDTARCTSDAQNPFTIIQCYIGIQNWSRIPSPSFGHSTGLRTATTFPCPANLGGSKSTPVSFTLLPKAAFLLSC